MFSYAALLGQLNSWISQRRDLNELLQQWERAEASVHNLADKYNITMVKHELEIRLFTHKTMRELCSPYQGVRAAAFIALSQLSMTNRPEHALCREMSE